MRERLPHGDDGYTSGRRHVMRSTDGSIRLIDRGGDPAITIDQR
jgi:hypothetical protein